MPLRTGPRPEEGRRLVGREHVGGDDLDASLGLGRSEHAVLVDRGGLVDAKGARDGRTGDVAVEDADLMTATTQLAGEHRRRERLADASLAAGHGDNVLDLRTFVKLQRLRSRAIGARAVAAGGAIRIATQPCLVSLNRSGHLPELLSCKDGFMVMQGLGTYQLRNGN